jgi:hypothetical protein
MAHGQITLRQIDVKRLVKGALAGGASWARVKVDNDGSYEILAGVNAPAEASINDLDKWIKEHARQA